MPRGSADQTSRETGDSVGPQLPDLEQCVTPGRVKHNIAKDQDARVVVLGDSRQHRSVSRGQLLKLLEEKAGLPVAEVTEIVRQKGDYRKIAEALREGKTAEGLAMLDRLGWIREVPDAERYQALAEAYLSAVQEKKRGGGNKSALIVAPTHAELARITQSIRNALKDQGKLGEERPLAAWIPAHFTDAQKRDASNYETGDLLLYHQNAPGITNGARVVVTEGANVPTTHTDRFEVFRPATIAVAIGDRVRVTSNCRTRDGKHRLDNGALYTVRGFTPKGDVVIDHGWVVGANNGVHLTHGYAVTSHASQGKTVDKVFVGLSSQSLPAMSQRSLYVAATRGRDEVMLFTDSKKELVAIAQKPDDPLSAVDLVHGRNRWNPFRQRLNRHLTYLRRQLTFNRIHAPHTVDRERTEPLREARHER
ncbi:AAA family ATPase [Gemmata sp. SH-PL17]|uniref:AAA family ATPase n=1 Tax=Gemmata sp. SH-PL17 TaxID=1630693 RepID=UPI0009EEB4AA|nr:AAA family ATPase [Gemmata sp. SH-PL17]